MLQLKTEFKAALRFSRMRFSFVMIVVVAFAAASGITASLAQAFTASDVPPDFDVTVDEVSSAEVASAPKSQSALTPRIVGGQEVVEAYSWMVSLQVRTARALRDYQHICGGVLIDPYTVLTAAHCVVDLHEEDVRLVIGQRDISRVPVDSLRSVSEFVVHPLYNRNTFDNDLAVLRMIEPVTREQSIALPLVPPGDLAPGETLNDLSGDRQLQSVFDSRVLPESGFVYRILGWGATQSSLPEEATVASVLQEANIDVFTRQACENSQNLNATTFCAGALDGTVDSCVGDSGGPLIRVVPPSIAQPFEQYELMGLVSYGNGTRCGVEGVLGFYTDVQKFLAFINGVTQGRDHWVPFRWAGLNHTSRAIVPINNYSNQMQYFGVWSGDYADGVSLQANDCEQAQLGPGQGCSLIYGLTPTALGQGTVSTTLTYATQTPLGENIGAEKRLMGQVNVLPVLDVTEAFNLVGSQWFSGGDAPWRVTEDSFAYLPASLRSGEIGDGEVSVLQGYIDGPTDLEVYVLVESEHGFDQLVVFVDDVEQLRLSGAEGSGAGVWQRLSGLTVPAQGAILRFEYRKDASQSVGRDAAWIDIRGAGDTVDRRLLAGDTAAVNAGNQGSDGGSMSVSWVLSLVLLGMRRRWIRRHSMGLRMRLPSVSLRNMVMIGAVSMVGFGCAGHTAEVKTAQSTSNTQTEQAGKMAKAQSGSQSKSTAAQAVSEPLYSKRFAHDKLIVQVRTLGCTQAGSFRLVRAENKPGWYTVERVHPDYCRRAPMIMSVTLPVPEHILREIKGSDHPTQMRLTNIEVPSVGLPIIPPVVNP